MRLSCRSCQNRPKRRGAAGLKPATPRAWRKLRDAGGAKSRGKPVRGSRIPAKETRETRAAAVCRGGTTADPDRSWLRRRCRTRSGPADRPPSCTYRGSRSARRTPCDSLRDRVTTPSSNHARSKASVSQQRTRRSTECREKLTAKLTARPPELDRGSSHWGEITMKEIPLARHVRSTSGCPARKR